MPMSLMIVVTMFAFAGVGNTRVAESDRILTQDRTRNAKTTTSKMSFISSKGLVYRGSELSNILLDASHDSFPKKRGIISISQQQPSHHHNQRVCCDHQFTDRCSVRESPTRPRSSPLRLDPQASPDGASRLPLPLAHTAHPHIASPSGTYFPRSSPRDFPFGKADCHPCETKSASDSEAFVEVWEGERLDASYVRNFLSFKSALHTRFFPSGSLLVYTAKEANVPENEDEDSFGKFRFLPDYGECTLGEIHRRSPKSDSVDTRSEGNISPTVQAVSVLSATSNAAKISFGQAHYEYGEDGRRFGIGSCSNGLTAIWELGPSRASTSTSSGLGPSVLSDPATKISDPSRASFSAPHSRLKRRALGRFASAGDDDINPTVDKVRENFMDGFTGLCVENLSRGSRLEVIILTWRNQKALYGSRLPNPAGRLELVSAGNGRA
ncbi:hypothetical protein BGY98DRAFT_1189849 [Russula aff. rugulosa BPL654]|nr:hypothetical protein BGY98DRAFT_1189849 [Russula aff. rugulosa BPL654]